MTELKEASKEHQAATVTPFGSEVALHFDWTLRKLQGSNRSDLALSRKDTPSRTLNEEVKAAGIMAEKAYDWAVRTLLTMGEAEKAQRMQEAATWEERAKYIADCPRDEKLNPVIEEYLKLVNIAIWLKKLEDLQESSETNRRLRSLAEEIAATGSALGWACQIKGAEINLKSEFQNALHEAGIIPE